MNYKTRKRYAGLLEVARLTTGNLCSATERKEYRKLLEAAVDSDPNLGDITPGERDFDSKLYTKLSAILVTEPADIADVSPDTQLDAELEDKSGAIATNRDTPPLYSTTSLGSSLRGDDARREAGESGRLGEEDIYLVLRKHGVINGDEGFDLDNERGISGAREELSSLLAQRRAQGAYEARISSLLASGDAPITLFTRQVFGDGEHEGILQASSRIVARRVTHLLTSELGQSCGENTIGLDAPNFYSHLKRGSNATKTAILSRRSAIISPQEADRIIHAYLDGSSRFRVLKPETQALVVGKIRQAIIDASFDSELAPTRYDDVSIRQTTEGAAIKVTPVTTSSGVSPQPTFTYSTKSLGSTASWAIRNWGGEETAESTKKATQFIGNFAKDPIRTTTHYAYYSAISLLPKPIKNLYWRAQGKKDWYKNLKEIYQLTVDPDAQREQVEKLMLGSLKGLAKNFGLVNSKGQWLPQQALGYIGESFVTGFGETMGNIFSFVPVIGKPIGDIFKKRLGKKRNRKDSMGTALGLMLLDFVVLIPRVAWALLNKVPAVQAFRANIAEKWIGLEQKYEFFRTLRLVKDIGGSYIKGIFSGNTLAGGGIGFILSGGNPWATAAGATSGWLYQSWTNIASLLRTSQAEPLATSGTDLYNLLKANANYSRVAASLGPDEAALLGKPNFLARIFTNLAKPGMFLAEHPWLRIPIKGTAVGLILYSLGAPWWVIPASMGVDFLWQTRGWWGGWAGKGLGKIGSALASKMPFLGKIGGALGWFGKLFNVLGSIIGKLFHVVPYIPLGLDIYKYMSLNHASLPQAFMAVFPQWAHSAWGWAAYADIALSITGMFLKYGGYIALKDIAVSLFSGISGLIGSVSLATIWAAVWPVLVFLGICLVADVIIIAGYLQLPWNVEDRYTPVSECFEPKKTAQVVGKNPGDPLLPGDTIRYTIEINPKKPEIKDVTIKDFMAATRTNPLNTGKPIIDRYYLDGTTINMLSEPAPHIFNPLEPFEQNVNKDLQTYTFFSLKWEKLLVTPAIQPIIYEVKTHSKYTDGAIYNQVTLDGTWIDPSTGKRANCKTTVFLSFNSRAKDAATLAELIVNTLHMPNCYYPVVKSSNLSKAVACLRSASIPENSINEIINSVNTYKMLQCVGFVNAVEAGTGGTFQNVSFKSAKNYWRNINGYTRIFKQSNSSLNMAPEPGDILVWTSGNDGHVATVISTTTDMNGSVAKVLIAEAWGLTGEVRMREIPFTDNFVGWQRRQ